MDSRTDGALNGVSLREGNQIWVDYAGYRDTDPLCCPFSRTTATFEITRVGDVPVVRFLRAASLLNDNAPTVVTVPRPAGAPVQAPIQVPRGQ
jgi:hypothetical protein